MQKEKNKFLIVFVKAPILFFFFNSRVLLATCALGVSGLENCMPLKFSSGLSGILPACSLSSFAFEILMP